MPICRPRANAPLHTRGRVSRIPRAPSPVNTNAGATQGPHAFRRHCTLRNGVLWVTTSEDPGGSLLRVAAPEDTPRGCASTVIAGHLRLKTHPSSADDTDEIRDCAPARMRRRSTSYRREECTMTQEVKTHPGFHPDYHFPPGTTVNFADRIVIGSCYSFEPGEELRCRRCGSAAHGANLPAGRSDSLHGWIGRLRCGDHQVPGLRVGVHLADLYRLTTASSAESKSGR